MEIFPCITKLWTAKNNMNIHDTHWHDCHIKRVIEHTEKDIIIFEISHPSGEEYDSCNEIVFKDFIDYEIHEGPFLGQPTILDVIVINEDSNMAAIKIETNAGYRLLKCFEIEYN